MKNVNYDNKLSMILTLANKSGMILDSIGKEVGITGTTIGRWMNGVHQPSDSTMVLSVIRKRFKNLSKIDLNVYDLKKVKKDFGISYTSIAEEMGDITASGLQDQISKDTLTPERKARAQEILRSIGRRGLQGMV